MHVPICFWTFPSFKSAAALVTITWSDEYPISFQSSLSIRSPIWKNRTIKDPLLSTGTVWKMNRTANADWRGSRRFNTCNRPEIPISNNRAANLIYQMRGRGRWLIWCSQVTITISSSSSAKYNPDRRAWTDELLVGTYRFDGLWERPRNI